MKLLIITTTITACLAHYAAAFTTNISHPSRSTALFAENIDVGRIKKAGAGIATKPPGDNSSFDPNENGKLQGTGDCTNRILNGASYPAKTTNSAGNSVPTKTPSSNLRSLLG